jgi:hypothetical protein
LLLMMAQHSAKAQTPWEALKVTCMQAMQGGVQHISMPCHGKASFGNRKTAVGIRTHTVPHYAAPPLWQPCQSLVLPVHTIRPFVAIYYLVQTYLAYIAQIHASFVCCFYRSRAGPQHRPGTRLLLPAALHSPAGGLNTLDVLGHRQLQQPHTGSRKQPQPKTQQHQQRSDRPKTPHGRPAWHAMSHHRGWCTTACKLSYAWRKSG